MDFSKLNLFFCKLNTIRDINIRHKAAKYNDWKRIIISGMVLLWWFELVCIIECTRILLQYMSYIILYREAIFRKVFFFLQIQGVKYELCCIYWLVWYLDIMLKILEL